MKRRGAVEMLAAWAASIAFLPAAWGDEATPPANLPARVVLERADCASPPFDEEALARRLHVELAEDGVAASLADRGDSQDTAGAIEARIFLLGACSGGEMTAVLHSSAGGRAERALDVGSLGGALRERALALALAELVRTRWADIAVVRVPAEASRASADDPSPSKVERSQPDRPANVPFAPPHRTSRRIGSVERARPPLLLSAGIEWRFLFQRDAGLTGGRIAASIPVSSRWLGRISAEGAFVADGDVSGEAETSLRLYTGGLGVSAGYSWGDAELTAGPRIEVGYCDARFREVAPDARTIGAGGLVAIASGVASARVALVPRLWISLDIEMGYVLRGLESTAPEHGSLGLGGLLGSGRIGLGLAL